MPVTFEEMVQSVINVVREKEQALQHIQKLDAEIAALKKEVAELKKPALPITPVREPDKPIATEKPQLKEVK